MSLDLDSLRVADLKERLTELGLSTKGECTVPKAVKIFALSTCFGFYMSAYVCSGLKKDLLARLSEATAETGIVFFFFLRHPSFPSSL